MGFLLRLRRLYWSLLPFDGARDVPGWADMTETQREHWQSMFAMADRSSRQIIVAIVLLWYVAIMVVVLIAT